MATFIETHRPAGVLHLPVDVANEYHATQEGRDLRNIRRPGEQISQLDDADVLLDTLAAARRMRARADAAEAHALNRLCELRDGSRYLPEEVAPELRCTINQASARIARATALVTRLPQLLGLMKAGELEGYPASKVCDVTANLSDEDARRVDDALAEKHAAGTLNLTDPVALRRTTKRVAHRVDPDGMAERARTARQDRKVELIPGDDCMSTILARLPAEVASAIYTRLDGFARRLRNAGDPRTLDQLRSDVFTKTLLGQPIGTRDNGPDATIHIHMPVNTALTMSDQGCELAGYGPIPGPVAREIMTNPNSAWQAVLTDTGTGAPIDRGRTRRHPTQLIRDIVNLRDIECTTPGCHRPARYCDHDHLEEWVADNGPTSTTNGGPKCERHHYQKDHPDWRLDYQPLTGISTITTPAGRTHRKTREPIIQPRRQPQILLPDGTPANGCSEVVSQSQLPTA